MSSRRFRILVIDDERDHVELLCALLRAHHHDPVGVLGGFDAIRLLQEQRFDLVISDFKMPEIDGVELLGWLRRNQPLVGAVLLTGAAEEMLAKTATGDRQMIVLLQKPVDTQRLLIAVETLGTIVDIRRRANQSRTGEPQ